MRIVYNVYVQFGVAHFDVKMEISRWNSTELVCFMEKAHSALIRLQEERKTTQSGNNYAVHFIQCKLWKKGKINQENCKWYAQAHMCLSNAFVFFFNALYAWM